MNFLKQIFPKNIKENLGTDLRPGDPHYRAYVGPPKDYDLISAMVFNLLTCSGLRQHHKLLDIGCGSLRVGRLLIPYLNKGHYYGVEPNAWLVESGIQQEIGQDMIRIKSPTFHIDSTLKPFDPSLNFDYAFAQSIFSHTGKDLYEQWLKQIKQHLEPSAVFFATFLIGDTDPNESGWIYPACVHFRWETITEIASQHGFQCQRLSWFHPRQSWVAFTHEGFQHPKIQHDPLVWGNHSVS